MDKDIIDTPLIDQNLDSYEQFFDHDWSRRMFEAVRTSPLNNAICTLLVAWRFTNGAHMLPWLMAQSLKRFAEAEPNGSLRFRSDYSSESTLSHQLLLLNNNRTVSPSPSPEPRRKRRP